MADIGLEARLFDRAGNEYTAAQPITSITGCTAVLRSLDGWPDHVITFDGSQRDALMAWAVPRARIEVYDRANGFVALRGILDDPVKDISDSGDALKVTIKNRTADLTYYDTGRGRIYKAPIGAIVADIANDVTGWTCADIDTGGLVTTGGAVDWSPYAGTVATGSALLKSAALPDAWNTGATSLLQAHQGDGSFAFLIPSTTKFLMAGLAHVANPVYTYLDGACYFQPDGTWYYFAAGVQVSGPYTYAVGDAFNIAYVGGHLQIFQNGTRRVDDAVNTPVYPFFPQVSMYTAGAALQNCIFTYSAPPAEALYATRFEIATPQYALLSLSEATLKHLRQVRDANGTPLTALEFGDMGRQYDFWLISAEGMIAEDARDNPNMRLVAQLSKARATSQIVNNGIPLGAGQGGKAVQLDRLWRILYDATYPNHGHYGPADPLSIFPEYDERYPLSAMVNPYTGANGPNLVPIPVPRTYIPAKLNADASALISAATNDGQWDFTMFDYASVIKWGVMNGNLQDNSYSYTTQDAPAVEMVQRALYQATKAKFMRQSDESTTYTIVTEGRGLPPPEGDYVWLQFRHTNADDSGAYNTWNEDIPVKVIEVERTYATDAPPLDKWTVTTGVGRPQGNNVTRDTQKAIQALRLVPDIEQVALPLGARDHVDDTHPLVIPFITPDDVFRVASVSFYVDTFNPRSPIAAAGVINENQGVGNTGQAISTATGSVAVSTGGVVSSNPYGTLNSGNVQSFSQYGINNSGGVVSGSTFGPTSTGGVLGSIGAGGVSGPNITYSYTAPGLDVSSVTDAVAAQSTNKTNLRHSHALQVGSNAVSPDNTTLHFIAQGGRSSFLEVKGGPSGQLWTNDWVPAGVTNNADPDHLHLFTQASAPITKQQHYISDTHNITHYHDINHYHDMQHYHDISHVHNIDHVHYFPHTHALVGGIFEITANGASYYVRLDGTDVTAQLVDAGGKVGPWAGAFAVPDLMVSPYCQQILNVKGKHIIEVHVAGAAGTHGFSALQAYGQARVQIGTLGVTAYAI